MVEYINIFIFLMTRRKTTCKEISEKFGFCVKTAYRKIENLSSVIPITTERGRRGGVYILPEYKKEFLKSISYTIS